MATASSPPLVSLDALREAVTTLELMQSFFPLPNELTLSIDTAILLPRLQAWIEAEESGAGSCSGKGKGRAGTGDWGDKARGGLEFVVQLELRRVGEEGGGVDTTGGEGKDGGEWVVEMSVVIPLLGAGTSTSPPRPAGTEGRTTLDRPSHDQTPRQRARMSVLQPSWLSRSQHIDLVKSFAALIDPPSPSPDSPTPYSDESILPDDDITTLLAAVDTLKELSQPLLPSALSLSHLALDDVGEVEGEFRVFYHFPSLSTKAKRKDLVDWAPEYGLTGFVLAGKPGILCVEGRPSMIDEYMGEIKSVSWADIPSFQKKVSEKHRLPLLPLPSPHPSTPDPAYRVFTDMQEITALIPQGGARGNRGEMRDVRDWMGERGLGDLFSIVVGVGSV